MVRHIVSQLDIRMTYRQPWYMAHDLEPIKGSVPDVPDAALAPWFQPPEMTNAPEWITVRPPYRDDSKVERYWSVALMPLRALALGFLFITFKWWYTGIFLGTILLIIVVFVAR